MQCYAVPEWGGVNTGVTVGTDGAVTRQGGSMRARNRRATRPGCGKPLGEVWERCGQISASAGITDVTPPSGWLLHRSGGDAKRDRSHHHSAVQPRRRLAAAPDHPGSARSGAWASAGLSQALPGLHAWDGGRFRGASASVRVRPKGIRCQAGRCRQGSQGFAGALVSPGKARDRPAVAVQEPARSPHRGRTKASSTSTGRGRLHR